MAEKVKIMSRDKYFRDMSELIDESNLGDKNQVYALYGYINAFFEMGFLEDKHFDLLMERLPLSITERDIIKL